MVKLFETYVIKKVTVTPPAPSGDAVQSERLQYDNRNTGKKATNTNAAAVVVAETSRMAEEAVAAAVLGQDTVANRKAVEDISNTVTATAGEVGRRQADLIETVIIPLVDVNRKAAIDTVPVTLAIRYKPNVVVSNTGFSDPNNAVDRPEAGTLIGIRAASSGLAGTTSNTVSGTIVISAPDNLPKDFPIVGKTMTLEVTSGTTNTGTLPLGQSQTMQEQISFDDGASFTTTLAFPTVNDGIGVRSYNVTSILIAAAGGGSPTDSQLWAALEKFRMRITGSVTSGTGLNAAVAYNFNYCFISFSTEKTY